MIKRAPICVVCGTHERDLTFRIGSPSADGWICGPCKEPEPTPSFACALCGQLVIESTGLPRVRQHMTFCIACGCGSPDLVDDMQAWAICGEATKRLTDLVGRGWPEES